MTKKLPLIKPQLKPLAGTITSRPSNSAKIPNAGPVGGSVSPTPPPTIGGG